MVEKNINITFKEAKEWFNSGNEKLKEISLRAFSEKELKFDYRKIKTFKDALLYLYDFDSSEYQNIVKTINSVNLVSKASAAMFMLNIVRKVLNTGYNLYLTRNTEEVKGIWYPYIKFTAKDSTYYKTKLNKNKSNKIGEIINKKTSYVVYTCGACKNLSEGLGSYYYRLDIGNSSPYTSFLGCAKKEIAEHLGKYFGMIIMKAMYGDIEDTKFTKY